MKYNLPIIGLFFMFLNGLLYAQNNLFFNTYGSSNGDEEMEIIIQTNDSGLLIAGASNSYSSGGDEDLIILKTDIIGTVQWSKVYGGTSNDMVTDVKKTSDGGFIVVGWTQSFGAIGYDFWVLKIDSNGNIQWQNRFGASGDEQAWSVSVDSNAYFVVGGTDSFGAGLTDLWALKLDLNGTIIWQKTYGSSGDEAPPGLYEEYVAKGLIDQNGDYLIAGMSDGVGHGATDIYLTKLYPSNGNIVWQYAYGDIDEESFWSFAAPPTGGYYLPGNTVDPITFEADLWVVYVNSSGTIQWQKTFGIPSKWDEALNATTLTDGSIVLASYFEGDASDWTASAIKADINGNFLWANQYKIGNLDWTNSVYPLNDNTLAFVGVTTNTTTWDEDLTLFRTNGEGNISGCNAIATLNVNTTNTNTTKQSISFAVNNTAVSPISTNTTPINAILTKSTICSEMLSVEASKLNLEKVIVFPNPTNGSIVISFRTRQSKLTSVLKNMLGQEISSIIWQDIDSFTLDIKEPRGIYFMELYNERREKTVVKIIKN